MEPPHLLGTSLTLCFEEFLKPSISTPTLSLTLLFKKKKNCVSVEELSADSSLGNLMFLKQIFVREAKQRTAYLSTLP